MPQCFKDHQSGGGAGGSDGEPVILFMWPRLVSPIECGPDQL